MGPRILQSVREADHSTRNSGSCAIGCAGQQPVAPDGACPVASPGGRPVGPTRGSSAKPPRFVFERLLRARGIRAKHFSSAAKWVDDCTQVFGKCVCEIEAEGRIFRDARCRSKSRIPNSTRSIRLSFRRALLRTAPIDLRALRAKPIRWRRQGRGESRHARKPRLPSRRTLWRWPPALRCGVRDRECAGRRASATARRR